AACGPSRCPAFVRGPAMDAGDVEPLTVKGNGKNCATATCPKEGSKLVAMKADGTVETEINIGSLECAATTKWTDGQNSYDHVMCKQPACPGNCIGDPFETKALKSNKEPTLLHKAHRDGCTYSCLDEESLFTDFYNPLSIPSAECTSDGKFNISVEGIHQFSDDKIGCWKCDLQDGHELLASSIVKPVVHKCIASCPPGYYLQYTLPDIPILPNRASC
ncbi:hypothetical protein PMAYCL1PPCAC_10802, partial [Pristionchus mayeri]